MTSLFLSRTPTPFPHISHISHIFEHGFDYLDMRSFRRNVAITSNSIEYTWIIRATLLGHVEARWGVIEVLELNAAGHVICISEYQPQVVRVFAVKLVFVF